MSLTPTLASCWPTILHSVFPAQCLTIRGDICSWLDCEPLIYCSEISKTVLISDIGCYCWGDNVAGYNVDSIVDCIVPL